jgi:hypothetical protein
MTRFMGSAKYWSTPDGLVHSPKPVNPKARPEHGLGRRAGSCQIQSMATLTIHLPEPLDATLTERVRTSGARLKEEYLLSLVESDCAAGTLERVLTERMAGPFAPLEPDLKERVRSAAAKSTRP